MLLLALDTCTERLVVGLRSDAPEAADRWINLDTRVQDGPGNHARELIPAVAGLLEGRRPDAVGIALGPGSFTGVRIGLASAKGLAEGWGCPLIGLDNLEAMADSWRRLAPESRAAVLPIIDARKQKFYGMLWAAGRTLSPAADRSAEGWVEAVGAVWSGPVVVSGYQGAVLAQTLDGLPPDWSVLPLHDWTPGLLDQLQKGWNDRTFLPPDAGPRYLRLSEAEENLRLRG